MVQIKFKKIKMDGRNECVKWMTGMTRRDKARNEYIRESVKVCP